MVKLGDLIRSGTPGYPEAGKRPAWLDDYDQQLIVHWNEGTATHPQLLACFPRSSWNSIAAFAVVESCWAYAPIAAGYTPWAGGETAPADWDGVHVMQRSGYKSETKQKWRWTNDGTQWDIIGYKRKTLKQWIVNDEVIVTPKPEHVPLYTQARNLLNILAERYSVTVQPGLDVAELLNQIDNVTTGIHLPTLDKACAALAAEHAAPRQVGPYDNGVRYGLAEGERLLNALRPAPPLTRAQKLARQYREQRGGEPVHSDADRAIEWMLDRDGTV